jgi:hypothetical protein
MLNGASAALGGDNLPIIGDIVPAGVCGGWPWHYSAPGGQEWVSGSYAYVKAWIAAVTGVDSTSAWKPLGIVPWAITFDGESLLGAITTVLRQYYPGWRWRYNPVTNALEVLDPYDEAANAPIEYDCETSERIYLDDVDPLVANSYTRVIVEGRSSADTAVPTATPWGGASAKGFVDQSAAFKSTTRVRHDFSRPPGFVPPETEDSDVNVTITTTTYNGVDADSYVFILSKDQQSGLRSRARRCRQRTSTRRQGWRVANTARTGGALLVSGRGAVVQRRGI